MTSSAVYPLSLIFLALPIGPKQQQFRIDFIFLEYSIFISLLFFSVFGVDERKKLETALLGKRAQFQCNVQSSDASEVTLWWQFGGQNLTTLTTDDQENRHHAITGGIF